MSREKIPGWNLPQQPEYSQRYSQTTPSSQPQPPSQQDINNLYRRYSTQQTTMNMNSYYTPHTTHRESYHTSANMWPSTEYSDQQYSQDPYNPTTYNTYAPDTSSEQLPNQESQDIQPNTELSPQTNSISPITFNTMPYSTENTQADQKTTSMESSSTTKASNEREDSKPTRKKRKNTYKHRKSKATDRRLLIHSDNAFLAKIQRLSLLQEGSDDYINFMNSIRSQHNKGLDLIKRNLKYYKELNSQEEQQRTQNLEGDTSLDAEKVPDMVEQPEPGNPYSYDNRPNTTIYHNHPYDQQNS